MPAIYDHRHTVTPEEVDELNHVNNVEYIRWMQAAATAHSTAQGWSTSRYLEVGVGWVVRSHLITYLRPAFAGDEIRILTWVSNFRKTRSLRKYRIERIKDDALLAVAETDWAFISVPQHAPMRVLPEVAEAFVIVPADEEPGAT